MNPFGMGSAWSYGSRFFAGRTLSHALILIGIGILAPFVLQYAIFGEPLGTASPATMGRTLGTAPAWSAGLLAAMAISYVLQSASYFASWRLGFGGGRSTGGPLLYGLAAGLLAVAVVAVIGSVAALAAMQFGSSGVGFLSVLIFLIPLIAVFATFYTISSAMIGAVVSLLLGLAMIYGMIIGQVGLAATLVGGDGGVAVLLLVLSAVLMWLAARLCCVTCLMADAKGFGLIGAIRQSWRLTWDEQWAITRYLALVGFGLALLLLACAAAVSASAPGLLENGADAELQIGAAILGLVAAVPIAFLTVMVPAGIYRELTASEVPADIFA